MNTYVPVSATSVLWDAVSSFAAGGALLISMLVWLSQRRREQRQVDIQERLARVEEARRDDEILRRDKEWQAELVADVRILEFRMERPGGSGESDKVSITIENRGPGVAQNIDVALLDSEDRAPSNGLGNAVEELDEFGGYSGKSRKCYFQIPWELGVTRPLASLGAGEQVSFPFWLRYRAMGSEGIRLVWEDARGQQLIKPFVHFDARPAERY